MLLFDDEHFMRQALHEAQDAYDDGEVPVGAVLVSQNKIISRAHNQVERLKDPTAHAEILALTAAFGFFGAKYLPDCVLYVTVEPCHMCAGALYWSKLSKVVYGALDIKNGYRKFYGLNNPFHPKTKVVAGVLQLECATLMKNFFKLRR